MGYEIKVKSIPCRLCGAFITQETYPDGSITNLDKIKTFELENLTGLKVEYGCCRICEQLLIAIITGNKQKK